VYERENERERRSERERDLWRRSEFVRTNKEKER